MSVERLVQALTDEGVDFMVIGGWAAVLHGSARLTLDLDIFVSRKAENLRRLVRSLAPYRPRLRDLPRELPFIWDEATLRAGTIFTLSTDLGAIDVFAEVAGLGSFEEVSAQSNALDAFGRRVRTLDLRSLIRSKRATGREKDLAALLELESLLESEERE